jgi:formylglycine-generating enzyme required for sulfatase activity
VATADLFFGFRPASETMAEEVFEAVQGLLDRRGPEDMPFAVVRDRPNLPDEAWLAEVAPRLDDAEMAFVIDTRDSEGGFSAEPALARLGRRALAKGREVRAIVVQDCPGLLDRLGLGHTRALAIPQGGLGVEQPPYNGALAAWRDAFIAHLEASLDEHLHAAQDPQPGLLDSIAGAQAAVSAAQAAVERAGDGLSGRRAALDGALMALSGSLAAGAMKALAGDKRRLRQEREALERASRGAADDPSSTVAAVVAGLERCASRIDSVQAAATRDGWRLLDLDAAGETLVRRLSPGGDDAAIEFENAVIQSETGADEIQSLQEAADPGSTLSEAAKPVAAAAEDLRTALGWRPGVQPARLEEPDPLDPQPPVRVALNILEVDEATARLQASLATFRQIERRVPQALRPAVRSALLALDAAARSSARLIAPPLGRRAPREPDRRTPRIVWRSRAEGLATPLPEMVTLPRGRFLMGSPPEEGGRYTDEDPRHSVRIGRIVALGRYPVTFAQWDAAHAAGADLPEPDDQGWGRGRRPVINVSWDDAKAYIAWLNDRLNLTGALDAYRLPSEAEWEYACRAGSTTPFHFGETISTAQANYDGNFTYGEGAKGRFRERTTPVDAFEPNPWGLFDMHGNVWEWCEDSWHDDYAGAPADGSAWRDKDDASSRVLRGGSWGNFPQFLRSACRSGDSPAVRDDVSGFRLARTLSNRAS